MNAFAETVNFIWSVADLLRGDFKPQDYEAFVLPFTVLRRFDCVLEATRTTVWAADVATRKAGLGPAARHERLLAAAKAPFYNATPLDLITVCARDAGMAERLRTYVDGFSDEAQHIFAHFKLGERIAQLERKRLLAPVLRRFATFGLYPPGRAPEGQRAVGNHEMGLIFEELIRRFKEQSQETAGEHFTPRGVVRLMVELLFGEDLDAAESDGAAQPLRTLYDPACGTGGMLSGAVEALAANHPEVRLEVFGQELNEASYAIARADLILRGRSARGRVKLGNSFTADGFPGSRFDYCICNPPYGVSWKKVKRAIEHEAKRGHKGRFGAGLPRISDGSLLFLQHMIAKMKDPADGGTRIAVVFAASPLFSGVPGSGESEIRRWIIENDWLEAVIALPDSMFYNTTIRTFIWLVTNRKAARRRGQIQLIDGMAICARLSRSLGDKRNALEASHIDEVVQLYRAFSPGPNVRIFESAHFGFQRVMVDRPLRLAFRVDAAGRARLRTRGAWLKPRGRAVLSEDEATTMRAGVEAVLDEIEPGAVWMDRAAFKAELRRRFAEAGVKVPAKVVSTICDVFGERDPDAAPCRGRDGLPEADPHLRDAEDIPLDVPIGAWIAREVLPHAPDAWVEPDSAKRGYQIHFDRVFHTWSDPRPVSEIAAELDALEAEAASLMREILR